MIGFARQRNVSIGLILTATRSTSSLSCVRSFSTVYERRDTVTDTPTSVALLHTSPATARGQRSNILRSQLTSKSKRALFHIMEHSSRISVHTTQNPYKYGRIRTSWRHCTVLCYDDMLHSVHIRYTSKRMQHTRCNGT